MKKLLIFIIAASLFSCSKKSEPEKMNGIEFRNKYKIKLPFLDYGDEIITARSGNRKQKAQEAVLSVAHDLVISGSVECTTSPMAEWGAIQYFTSLPLSIDGAYSYCNFNWSYSTPPAAMVCPTTTAGVYRGWTSDHSDVDGNRLLHLSEPMTIN